MKALHRCPTLVLLLLMASAVPLPAFAGTDPQNRPVNRVPLAAILNGDAACAFAFRCFSGPAALDRDTAVVGTTNSSLAIYLRNASNGWALQQVLVDPDFPPTPFFVNNGFGSSVGLSGDTLITNLERSFPLEVFRRHDGVWTRTQLIPGKPVPGRGIFVSEILLDGSTALVNVFYEYAPGARGPAGAVLVFNRQRNGQFVQEAEILPNRNQPQSGFNFDIALQGHTALLGSITANGSRGAVYVYRKIGNRWLLLQTLTAPDAVAGSQFGLTVRISGLRIVVAAPEQPNAAAPARPGAVYTFIRSPLRWRARDKLVAPFEPRGEPGSSTDVELEYNFASTIAFSGRRLLVGLSSRGNTSGFDLPFGALLYERVPGQWIETGQIVKEENTLTVFASMIDRDTALVGASESPFGSFAATYALPPLLANPAQVTPLSQGDAADYEEAFDQQTEIQQQE